MSNDPGNVSRINWTEVFSFPHIFRSFKLAVQPGKLLLALAVLILLTVGGWGLDRVWGLWDGTAREGEIFDHATETPAKFESGMEEWKESRAQRAATLLADTKTNWRNLTKLGQLGGLYGRPEFQKRVKDFNTEFESDQKFLSVYPADEEFARTKKKGGPEWDDLLEEAENYLDKELDKAEKILGWKTDLEESLSDAMPEDTPEKAQEQFEEMCAQTPLAVTRRKMDFQKQYNAIRGHGIGASFVKYESDCLRNAVMALWNLNFRGGLTEYVNRCDARQQVPPA